ncbi:TIGR03862 family flavoprotein [Sneathiella marina]|uniref:TIGR03862 family flavoprotein n=1 Tax=Sneathiella marina TaxID=2950108 RepID=A0ABY4W1X6_9PROT|nr:TIGR03862 family flavoprotein [Sneathiella marina]USG60954.1 TIGR03862 family flavoprotein [Sneathiella marina]
MTLAPREKIVAIIGAGPAGLIAAQKLSGIENLQLHVFDQKPSVARKFLIAGRGGLNLTHSEPLTHFTEKYAENAERFSAFLKRFSPEDMMNWAAALGISVFKGSSGRIFPDGLKATPLLRAWLKELERAQVQFHLRHRWLKTGDDQTLVFSTQDNPALAFKADAILYAMGGASYPHLGAIGDWIDPLRSAGINIAPLSPSNCGFQTGWSDHFISRFEGAPLKNIRLSHENRRIAGDLVITKSGLEGGALYALSKPLREQLSRGSVPIILLDLKPEMAAPQLAGALSAPRGKISLSNFLRKKLKFSPIQTALLHEFAAKEKMTDPEKLGKTVKALPIPLQAINGIERAISSAGGVKFKNLNNQLMIKNLPGQFVAGEMLDWEAPTGGYLLQGCFATGVVAAEGIARYLDPAGR